MTPWLSGVDLKQEAAAAPTPSARTSILDVSNQLVGTGLVASRSLPSVALIMWLDDELVVFVQEILDLQQANNVKNNETQDTPSKLDASEVVAALTASRSELGGKRKTRNSASTSMETPEGLTALVALTVRKLQAR